MICLDATNPLAMLERMIRTEIPITQHMALSVRAFDARGLVLGAALAPNRNHQDTAFGGSLNMLVTLAGWGMVQLLLVGLPQPARVVIQKSTVAFRHPVRHGFDAVCPHPGEPQRARFIQMLTKHGKARIRLHCHIHEDGKEAVAFEGSYVALQHDAAL